ncbi:MAG TPA: hypothetical protein VLH41_06340, partial [Thermoanaerobaculia bacterium]|nr:hypothetical protein [Thermoanaerobaculia bacterium]
MKKTLFSLAAVGLLASPALLATDEQAVRPVVRADTLIRGVQIPFAFRGLDGKTQPPGIYEMS